MQDINITEVKLRRKFNLGNFESMDVELVATITPLQDPQEVLKQMDETVILFKTRRMRELRGE